MSPEEIRRKRIALNLTQTELAEKFKVKTNTIARWERGEIIPTAKGMLHLTFQYLEHERHLDDSAIENLRAELTEKVGRSRVRHKRNRSEWINLNK